MTKPTDLPEWDKNETSTVTPGASREDDGWLVPAGVPEKPPYQIFNHWQNNVYKWLKYTNEQGITEWDTTITYEIGAYAVASDDLLYRALISQAGNTPVGDATNWYQVGSAADIVNDQNGGLELKTAVYPIGDWDMNADSTVSISIDTGIDSNKIVSTNVMIVKDDLSNSRSLQSGFTPDKKDGDYYIATITSVAQLFRVSGGIFDTTSYDSTSFNRGFITITYFD